MSSGITSVSLSPSHLLLLLFFVPPSRLLLLLLLLRFVVCVVFGHIRCTTLFSCYCLRTTLSFSSLLLFVIAIILRTTLSFVIATPSLLLFVVF
jgi:hypothetical protein